MSPTKRRSRRERSSAPAHPAAQVQVNQVAPAAARPLQWRTLPVFFAFALGGFIGLEVGTIAGYSDNQTLWTVGTVVFAGMFGLALSRIIVRWMMGRGMIKPKVRKGR